MPIIVEPSPTDTLKHWQDLYDIFRKQTPSSPDWFRIVDHCVGRLMEDHIKELAVDLSKRLTKS